MPPVGNLQPTLAFNWLAMKELGKDVPEWKKDADSIEGRKVGADSKKRWQAVRDKAPAAYNTVVFDAEFNRTGPDAKRRPIRRARCSGSS